MTSQAKPIILFVEDEDQQRDTLKMVLEVEGYSVVPVISAELALDYLRHARPQLIVSDVKLGGMDGISFFEKVHADAALSPIPFIFITGYNDPAEIERLNQLGAVGYITKPYDLGDLIARIKAFFSSPTASKA